jgi:hypothetical protein
MAAILKPATGRAASELGSYAGRGIEIDFPKELGACRTAIEEKNLEKLLELFPAKGFVRTVCAT